MNKISLVGRLTKDPELSTTNSGLSYCRFNVASKSKMKNVNGDDKVDFFICVAWRDKAELIHKYCAKGDQVQVMGSMGSRSYEGADGDKKTIWELNVEDIEFLTSKAEKEQNSKSNTKKAPAQDELEEIDDDSLPF